MLIIVRIIQNINRFKHLLQTAICLSVSVTERVIYYEIQDWFGLFKDIGNTPKFRQPSFKIKLDYAAFIKFGLPTPIVAVPILTIGVLIPVLPRIRFGRSGMSFWLAFVVKVVFSLPGIRTVADIPRILFLRNSRRLSFPIVLFFISAGNEEQMIIL